MPRRQGSELKQARGGCEFPEPRRADVPEEFLPPCTGGPREESTRHALHKGSHPPLFLIFIFSKTWSIGEKKLYVLKGLLGYPALVWATLLNPKATFLSRDEI